MLFPAQPPARQFIFHICETSIAISTHETRTDDGMQEMHGRSLERIIMIQSRYIEVPVVEKSQGGTHCGGLGDVLAITLASARTKDSRLDTRLVARLAAAKS